MHRSHSVLLHVKRKPFMHHSGNDYLQGKIPAWRTSSEVYSQNDDLNLGCFFPFTILICQARRKELTGLPSTKVESHTHRLNFWSILTVSLSYFWKYLGVDKYWSFESMRSFIFLPMTSNNETTRTRSYLWKVINKRIPSILSSHTLEQKSPV